MVSTKTSYNFFSEDWPRRPPPSPDAYGLPAFPPLSSTVIFFFCGQHTSVSLPTTSTRSWQHIPLSFCLLPEFYAFIIFSLEVFSSFHQPSHLFPAPAGRYLTSSILSSTCQSLALRLAGYNTSRTFSIQSILSLSSSITPSSGASRPLSYIQHSYPSTSQSLAFRLCRPHASRLFFVQSNLILSPAVTLSSGTSRQYLTRIILIPQKPFHLHPALLASTTPPAPNQLPTLSPDALRHLPMPPGYLPFPATLPQTSTPPIPHSFLFLFISSTIFLFFFLSSFLSSSPFLFFSSLYF